MKTLLLILVLLSSFSAVSAQALHFYFLEYLSEDIDVAFQSEDPETIKTAIEKLGLQFVQKYNGVPQELNYHKHDSVEIKNWDASTMAWQNSASAYLDFDCERGLTIREHEKENLPSPFSYVESSDVEYYIDGNLKSLQHSFMMSDSSSWGKFNEYSYLPSGILTQAIKYPGPFNNSDHAIRVIFYYDSINRLVLIEFFKWGESLQEWYPYLKYSYAYNNNGKLLQKVKSSHAGSNWKEIERWYNIYGLNNSLDTTIHQTKNFTPTWVDKSRTSFEYGANNLVSAFLVEEIIGNLWMPKRRQINIYDSNDRLIQIETQKIVTMNTWVGDVLKKISYHSNGDAGGIHDLTWDSLQNEWVEYAFDSLNEDGNRVVLIKKVNYDNLNSTFSFGTKRVMTWNGSQVETSYFYILENQTLDNWQLMNKYYVNFDAKGLKKEIEGFVWNDSLGMFINSQLLTFFNSDCQVNYAGKTTDLKGEFCTLTNPIKTGQIVYCNNTVGHSEYTVKLYDFVGNLLFSQQLNKSSFVIQNVKQDGLYVLVVQKGNTILFREKLVIMN